MIPLVPAFSSLAVPREYNIHHGNPSMKSTFFVRTLLLSASIGSISLVAVFGDTPSKPAAKPGGIFGDNKTQYTAPDPVADQRKVVQAAGKKKKEAETAFNKVVTDLKKQYESSDDYKKLLADIKNAQDAYSAAVEPINKSLKDKPEYAAAVTAHDTAQKTLDDLAKKSNISLDDRKNASDALKEADDKISTMQAAAYDADPNIKALKAKIDEATKAARTAKLEFEKSGIKENSDWVKAKSDLEAATSNLADASQQLKDLIDPPPASQPAINAGPVTSQAPPKEQKKAEPKKSKHGHPIPGT